MVSSDTNPLQETDSSAGADSSATPEAFGKEEAAQFLGVSSRALERYTASGRLAVGYAPGKTRSVAVYERVELEHLKGELQRPLLRGTSGTASEGAASGSSPVFPNRQTTPTATRTATTPTKGVDLQGEQGEAWDGQTTKQNSSNPDSVLDAVSDELVAVSPGAVGGAENALDALTQLVLERLLERLHSEAAIAASPNSSTASPSSLAVLASATPLSKAPLASPGEKLLLTLPEAAALTGLSRAFLKNAISDGALVAKPIGRLWRVKRSDLDTFIAAL